MAGGGLAADHAVIEYAGDTSVFFVDAPLTFDRANGPTHCSHLRNVTIRDSSTYAVHIEDNYSNFVFLGENMQYSNVVLPAVVGAANGPAVLDGEVCPPR